MRTRVHKNMYSLKMEKLDVLKAQWVASTARQYLAGKKE